MIERHPRPPTPAEPLLDAWNSILDDFEMALEQVLTRAARDDVAVAPRPGGPFAPPESIPPMPVELAERARDLLARTDRAVEQVREAAARVHPRSAPPSPVPHVRRRSTSPPSFDARA